MSNTDYNIEVLTYALTLAKSLKKAENLYGLPAEQITISDIVTAARMVIADKDVDDMLSKYADTDSVHEMAKAEKEEHFPESPTTQEVGVLRRAYMDTPAPYLMTMRNVPYYRSYAIAADVLETSVLRFVGFWCADCDSPHLLERHA